MNFLLVLLLALVCIGLPLGWAWRVWRLDEPTRGAWLLLAADATILLLLVLALGRWDIAGYYTRFVLVAVFCLAGIMSYRRHAGRPWQGSGPTSVLRTRWTTLVSLCLFGAAGIYVAEGFLASDRVVDLTFPLEDGWFIVGQGGDNRLLNHHNPHPTQRFAADILALNAAGSALAV